MINLSFINYLIEVAILIFRLTYCLMGREGVFRK
jgi:hypothetical protein